jgi:hypothetical protein
LEPGKISNTWKVALTGAFNALLPLARENFSPSSQKLSEEEMRTLHRESLRKNLTNKKVKQINNTPATNHPFEN